MTLTAATLFSGIGAPEVAMPGWRWAWHAEIEKFPSAVLAARHPGSVNLGDVSAQDFAQKAAAIARPDVIVFGSPCQSFSVAGKRLGLDDARGNLALTALGIVDRLKPDWFVFENVPGLFSSFSGAEQEEGAVREGDVGGQADGEEDRDLAAFLSRVRDVGYSLAWGVLDAQWTGVAQRRERLFAVGHSGDWRYPAAILLEPESLCGDHPPRREAGQRPAGTIGASPRGGGGINSDFDGGLIPDISHCLNAGGMGRQDYETETVIAHAMRADGHDASEDGTGHGTPLIPVAFDCKAGGNTGFSIGDTAGALRGEGFGGGHAAVAIPMGQDGLAAVVDEAMPLSQLPSAHQVSRRELPSTSLTGVRRLTPRECERLQGFPDDYTLIDYRGRAAADGPRYKALGNSMAVPVIRWILNRIELFETHIRPNIGRAA